MDPPWLTIGKIRVVREGRSLRKDREEEGCEEEEKNEQGKKLEEKGSRRTELRRAIEAAVASVRQLHVTYKRAVMQRR